MVAHPLDCAAIAAGSGHHFHRKFRHRLGALFVLLNHVSAAPYSRPVGILS